MTTEPNHGQKAPSAFDLPNIRRFIAFRIFFNSRFYYPVFTILFLDFGLSLEQFALLNAIWAAVIVVFEVPSGALADVMGRRNVLVTTGGLMVVEIGLLCVAPRDNPGLLFAFFAMNRILSGLAEATASGADEALAYDTLKAHGLSAQWGKVLAAQLRYRSIAFIAASVIGALVYDPALMEKAFNFIGLKASLTQEDTLRVPLFLTWIMAFGAWWSVLGMREPGRADESLQAAGIPRARHSPLEALRITLQTAGFIAKTPIALAIILAGTLMDHVPRMVITLASEYYRIIGLPEASFGFIGAGLALSGIFVPRIALHMTERHSMTVNFWIVSGLCAAALWAMTRFWPIWGLVPALLLFSAMMMGGFFVSHYLNAITDSRQRATVLSVKGLCFNLAYGLIGMAYAALVGVLRSEPSAAWGRLTGQALENAVFRAALGWFPGYFIAMLLILVLFLALHLARHRRRHPGNTGSA